MLLYKSTEIFDFVNTFRSVTIIPIVICKLLAGSHLDWRDTPPPVFDAMATSDIDQLIDMGFDRERAQLAVSKTGGRTYLYHDMLIHKGWIDWHLLTMTSQF